MNDIIMIFRWCRKIKNKIKNRSRNEKLLIVDIWTLRSEWFVVIYNFMELMFTQVTCLDLIFITNCRKFLRCSYCYCSGFLTKFFIVVDSTLCSFSYCCWPCRFFFKSKVKREMREKEKKSLLLRELNKIPG